MVDDYAWDTAERALWDAMWLYDDALNEGLPAFIVDARRADRDAAHERLAVLRRRLPKCCQCGYDADGYLVRACGEHRQSAEMTAD